MDELTDIFEHSIDRESNVNKDVMGERGLISAIFHQAASDATNPDLGRDYWTARSFIKRQNGMFQYYCALLDFNAEWLHGKLWKYINPLHEKNIIRIRKRHESHRKKANAAFEKLMNKLLALNKRLNLINIEVFHFVFCMTKSADKALKTERMNFDRVIKATQ
jgi:hypothetical protein